MDDTFEASVGGLVNLAHDGFRVARTLNGSAKQRLHDASETLVSAAVVVLRHEKAMIPRELVDVINFVHAATEGK